jgi:endonuclease/exonuclease/phosphatase family metal-dependent hydrolase
MRFYFFIIFALSVHGCSADSAASDARIVGWNLGADAFSVDGTLVRNIPDWRVEQQAQFIAMISPDLIALSEVAPDSVVDDLVRHLATLGRCYKSVMLPQSSNLNVGFLYACQAEASNPRFISGSALGRKYHRKALAVDVTIGSFDLTAIVVHLKAGRSSHDRHTRTRQARAIWTEIETDLLPAERDIMVLGDCNMIPAKDRKNFKALNPTSYFRFITSDDLEPRQDEDKIFSNISFAGGMGNLLDCWAISASDTSEYVEGSVAMLPAEKLLDISLAEFKKQYSDHLPMIAVFDVSADDD